MSGLAKKRPSNLRTANSQPADADNVASAGSTKHSLKEDALALAEVIYDIFKENQLSGKITDGQNHANQIKDT